MEQDLLEAKNYLSQQGYGSGTNYTTNLVAVLLANYAQEKVKKLQQHSVMQVPQFEELLQVRLEELPYTKHLDDGQYNDGQAYGFECGARWAYEKLSSGTTVGKAGVDASVSDGTCSGGGAPMAAFLIGGLACL